MGCEAGAERPVCHLEGESIESHYGEKKPTQEAEPSNRENPVLFMSLDPAVPEFLLPLNLFITRIMESLHYLCHLELEFLSFKQDRILTEQPLSVLSAS